MSVKLEGPPLSLTFHPALRALFATYAEELLEKTGCGDCELSILLTDDSTMAELNGTYRGRQQPTDVLSFSLTEGTYPEHRGTMLGDVVIDLDAARSQARARNVGLLDELIRLLVHGLLHLLGHDHQQSEDAQRMQNQELQLFRELRP